ncbi:MAG: DNA repair protein RecN [Gemmatimonadaceae bacterium]
MLLELRLRNVAVIDAVTLPLAGGLNVLSGETGAGKSLIVGALGMLLGERAAADRVRAGADKATVEGVFQLRDDATVRALLEEQGIDPDDGMLILKREIAAGGRSRAWINGAPVTAAILAAVGAQLVSVHGQHDARLLLDADVQRALLDAYADAGALVERVATAHAVVRALEDRQASLEVRRAEVARRADYLRFLVQEIAEVSPIIGEDETIDADIRRLSHASELQTLAAQAAAALDGDDDAVVGRLGAIRRLVGAIERIDTDVRWSAALENVVVGLAELVREMSDYADGIEVDAGRLLRLETRRAQLQGLRRKYGPSIEEVLDAEQHARAELALVDTADVDLAAIREEHAQAMRLLREVAAQLSERRAAAAQTLADAVTALLPDLGMAHGQLVVVVQPLEAITAHGAETVSVLATLNAGSEPRPLARIASGGELARLMLALSTVLARRQQVPTLVFDEVDAGIGGTVAWQVGALMRRVAGHHQVLAISHLAQIAACAHHHIVVQKGAVGTVTTADTAVVAGDARVQEIARMLGGDADREVSRAHARELLERGAQRAD